MNPLPVRLRWLQDRAAQALTHERLRLRVPARPSTREHPRGNLIPLTMAVASSANSNRGAEHDFPEF